MYVLSKQGLALLVFIFISAYANSQQKTKNKTVVKGVTTKAKSTNTKVKTVARGDSTKTKSAPVNVEMTAREKEMMDDINAVRKDPASYIPYIDKYLDKFNGGESMKAAAAELAAELKKLKPLHTISLDMKMYNDAKEYGLSMAKSNVFTHSKLPYYENLSLGHKDIRDAILDLLIDDGISNRGHRKNLLNENLKYGAVYEVPGKVKNIPYCYVQEFR